MLLSITRRTVARVAVAGAVVAAPLAVVTIPAQADAGAGPGVTEVHGGHGHHPWDRPGLWDNPWDRHDHWDDWDRDRRRNHPGNGWRQAVPPGWLGSS